MSSLEHSNIISMDRAAKNCNKISLKFANSIMALTGIAILMYSSWMIVSCFREYHAYSFPWFTWACLGTGIIFMLTACIGHAGADTMSNFLLSLYILFMTVLILVEILVTANMCLNEEWDKDFPKDRTGRFNEFVEYVDSNLNNFTCVGMLISFSQDFPKDRTGRFNEFVEYVDSNLNNFTCVGMLISFSQILALFLAMLLRTMGGGSYMKNEDEEASHPFLNNHHLDHLPPYAIGHPETFYYPTIPPYAYPQYYSKTREYVAPTTKTTPKDC